MTTNPDTRHGQVVGARWRLLERLGTGGTGVVYAAIEDDTGSRAAVKVAQAHGSARLAGVIERRLRREREVSERLDGTYSVAMLAHGQLPDGAGFLVMERLDGETLRALIRREIQLEAPQAAELGRRVAEALQAVHESGVIHRDIKPDHVFLCDDGRLKLLDFDVAWLPEDADGPVWETEVGTPSYMAPEQARREPPTPASDIYSLGLVIHEMLFGALPARRPSSGTSLSTPRPVPALRNGDRGQLVAWLAFLDELLADDPGARPQTGADVAARLTALCSV